MSVIPERLTRHIPIGLRSDRRWLQVTILLRTKGMDHRFTKPMEPIEQLAFHRILMITDFSVEMLTRCGNG